MYHPNLPLISIAAACDFASQGIYLSNKLPFYVRDMGDVLVGYCVVGEYMGSVTAPTYKELHTKMIELWRMLNEKDEK